MFYKKDQLFPLYTFKRSEDGWITFFVRVVAFLLTVSYIIYLSQIPNLMQDVKEISMRTHDEAKAWGIEKIHFNFTNVNKNALTKDLDEEENDESNADSKEENADSQINEETENLKESVEKEE